MIKNLKIHKRNIKLSILTLLALVNTSLAISPAYAEKYQIYYDNAIRKGNLGDIEGALFELEKAIKLKPKLYYLYLTRGQMKAFSKDYEGAILDIEKSIKHSKKYPEFQIKAYSSLYLANYDKKDYLKALRAINKLLVLDPKNAFAYSQRGVIKVKLNNEIEGLDDINKAIDLDPNDGGNYYNRGIFYYNLYNNEKNESACKDFIKGSELGYKSSNYYLTGRRKEYCYPYMPQTSEIPNTISDSISDWNIEAFLDFESTNHCLESEKIITAEQAEFRRLTIKNNPIYSTSRISHLDFNYLMYGEKSKNDLKLLINEKGGCKKIINDLKDRFNGTTTMNEYTKETYTKLNFEEALSNALTYPRVKFYSREIYHPNYSIKQTKDLISKIAPKEPNKWGRLLAAKKTSNVIVQKRNRIFQPVEVCKPDKWYGYPTRKRTLGCLNVFQVKNNLRVVKYKHLTEQINPKKDTIKDYTITYLVDCKKDSELATILKHKSGRIDKYPDGLWTPISKGFSSRLNTVCSNY